LRLDATGLPENQIIVKLVQDIIPEPAQSMVLANYKKTIQTKQSFYWEEITRYPSGIKHGEVTVNPIINADGSCTQLLGTVHDVTERQQAEEELKKYRDHLEELVKQRTIELEQVNLYKSRFLANMSHELRTPLNSIIGYTRLILDGLEGNITVEQREDLQTVYNKSKHLLSLINDLLDLSKIEAGKFEVIKTKFPISDLTAKVGLSMEKLAKGKGLTLTCSVAPGMADIYADKNKTMQVLFNLLGNAIKFTNSGGVQLKIGENKSETVFAVVDSGIGIKKGDMDALFKSYKQVGPARLAGYEGTGLGLIISTQFVEMQGGKIAVESEFGKGSTFTFTLPRK
jgi:PAS domain S-box-containing protein